MLYMKNSILLLLLICLVSTFNLFAQNTIIPPENRESEESFKKERERWIRQMHRTAPDVNWEVIERENREARIFRHEQDLRNKSNSILTENVVGTWTERGSNNLAGRMLASEIDFATNEIYAASAGGILWRGTLTGKNWTPLNDNQNFGNVNTVRVIHSQGLTRLFVCGDNPFFRYSDDKGKTWRVSKGLDAPKNWGGIRRAVFTNDGKNTIYLIGTEWDYGTKWGPMMSIYRSTDFGETFTNVKRSHLGNQSDPNNNHIADIFIPRYDAESDVYFLRMDTLSRFKSDFTEEIISIVNVPEILTSARDVTLFGNSSSNLAIGITGGNNTKIYTSSNGGSIFTYKGELPFDSGKLTISMSPTEDFYMYAGGVDLYRSTSAGAKWIPVNSWVDYYGDIVSKLHADIQVVNSFISPDGNEITLISNDGGLYYSEDLVGSVTNIGLEGLAVSQYYSTLTSSINPKVVFVGSQDQGYQKTTKDTNGRFTFVQRVSGDYGHLSSGDGGNSFWMDYPGFIDYHYNTMTEEQSTSWDWGKNGINGSLWLPPVQCEPNTSDIAYFAGGTSDTGAYLYKITKLSNGLKADKLPYNFGNAISAIGISEVNIQNRYVITTAGNVFYSNNKGITWSISNGFKSPDNHYFYGTAICTSPINPSRVYIGGSGYSNPGVYVSNDGGKTFDSMNVGLPKTLVYGLAVTSDDKFVFAATQNGAYIYSVEHGKWYDITTSQAPDQLYWSVEYVPSLKVARFGTYGRGIWDYAYKEPFTVGVEETISNNQDIPLSIQPNLINSHTEIVFQLSTEGQARIRIYDLNGKIVAEPFNSNATQGENRISWNGHSFGGGFLPSGSYMCALNALGKTQFVKLIVK